MVDRPSRSRTQYQVKAKSQFKDRSSATSVEILIPLPADATAPTAKTLTGSATYAPEKSALVWTIKNFPGGKEYVLRCAVAAFPRSHHIAHKHPSRRRCCGQSVSLFGRGERVRARVRRHGLWIERARPAWLGYSSTVGVCQQESAHLQAPDFRAARMACSGCHGPACTNGGTGAPQAWSSVCLYPCCAGPFCNSMTQPCCPALN